MGDVVSRRRILLGTVAGSVGLTALALARRASALTTENIYPGSSMGLAYSNRCGPDSEHAAIRASLEARLAGETAAPGATVSASQVCPICGCPIYASRTVYGN